MSTPVIKIQDINAANLVCPNPPKETTSKTGVKFTRLYFKYRKDGRNIEPLFEMGGKVTATVSKKVREDSGRVNWTLTFSVSESDIEGLNQITEGIKSAVFKYRNQFKQFNFSMENPGDLRGAYYLPRTENGELVEGAGPLMTLKIGYDSRFKNIKPVLDSKGAPVMDSAGQPRYETNTIEYNSLEGCSFDCAIVFKVRDLYHGGSGLPYPQLFVASCFLLSEPVKKNDVDYTQCDTIMNFLKSTTPEKLGEIAQKINGNSSSVSQDEPTDDEDEIQHMDLTKYSTKQGTMNSQQQAQAQPSLPQPVQAQLPQAVQQHTQQAAQQAPQQPPLDISSYMNQTQTTTM